MNSHEKRSAFRSGSRLTIADLPSPNTKRWGSRSKVAVVAAVENGLISFQEASANYNLSHEEFCTWRNLDDRYGFRKKTTRHTTAGETPDPFELHIY